MTQLVLTISDEVAEALQRRATANGRTIEEKAVAILQNEFRVAAKGFEALRKLLDESGATPLHGPFRREDAYQGKRFE
jgi:plasmid stability protein